MATKSRAKTKTKNIQLNKIKYKNFTFPNNPETTGLKCDRTYIKHKYPGLAGNELEDFGINAVSITGHGYFVGSNAYNYFHKLFNEYKKSGVGTVYHPVFSEITRGLMVSLESTIDPGSNCIEYSFEIIADTDPKKKESNNKNKGSVSSVDDSSSGSFNVGDVVYFKGGTHYVSSDGSKGYKATAGKAKITIKKPGKAHPYHLIHADSKSNVYGWVDASSIQSTGSSSSSSSSSSSDLSSSSNGKIVHTVKSGECLSVICAKYSKKYGKTINWRTIASKNKLSNPNKIYPGQKITIYY